MVTSGNPARSLVGQVVNGRWLVEERINLEDDESTGGNFSIPYRVSDSKTQQRAFLKVLDVVKAIQRYGENGASVAEAMSRLGSAHLFEVALVEACREKRLTRVVRALDSGELQLEMMPFGKVGFPFLVFELADGDTHKVVKSLGRIDLAWWFQTLRQAATGLMQLHGVGIAHQDLKASNVVFFGQHNAKLADLGRAVRKGVHSLNDDRFFAGDWGHAPPEYHYGHAPSDWAERHLATDLYMLGSLAFVVFSQVPMTSALFSRIPPEFLPQHFHGEYSDAIPALVNGQTKVLTEIGERVPMPLRDLLLTTLRHLCHPDPSKRGHPEDHAMVHGQPFSVERFISAFRQMELITRIHIEG